jgi:hypothetical protein
MQGVFVMVTGSGRVLASAVSGPVAAWSLSGMYACASALCVAAAGLIFFAYRAPARLEPALPEAAVELGGVETGADASATSMATAEASQGARG